MYTLSKFLLFYLQMTVTVNIANGVTCLNCSSTHRSWTRCGETTDNTIDSTNRSYKDVVNCTEDGKVLRLKVLYGWQINKENERFIAGRFLSSVLQNALCFIRSWRARAKHAWIVQRGCYELGAEETPPISLSDTRALSCKRQRLPDAEYKLCFCQGDQCNGSYKFRFDRTQFFTLLILNLFLNFEL